MKIHEREKNVNAARQKLMTCMMEIQEDLTEGEFLKVVTSELSDAIQTRAKYMIREERHPGSPDKPGGLA